MASARAAERLTAARNAMQRACDLLIAPTFQALEHSQDALQRAIDELVDFRSSSQQSLPDEAAAGIALDLRRDVFRATVLLQSLAGFYAGWEKILGTLSGGYTASGDAAPMARGGRVCFRG